jgi:putative hydrolase of the HAD superfamily
MSIQVVAFDVDGTLYPESLMYLNSIPFALRHFRLVHAFARVRRRLRDEPSGEDFRGVQARLLAAELGIDAARAGRLIEKSIYGEWEKTLRRIRPRRHLRETLGILKERGLKLALLSDFPIGRKLEYLGLEGFWDFTLCTEDSGRLKPHPGSFRELLGRFGIGARELLYVGNHYQYDILGARAVGAQTAHLTSCPPASSAADVSFKDYRSLAAWILDRIAG